MSTLKELIRAIDERETACCNLRDLARSLSPAAYYAPDYPAYNMPLIGTFWAANNDKAELQKLGLDIDNLFWRWYDIQPMAKYLRPNGKVAAKGLNGQYKLIEASEEFGLRMTSQRDLLGDYPEGRPRADRDSLQHCAVDDAVNTVRLTGLLMEDLARVDLDTSVQEGFPPKTVWPPDGLNTRIISIDTESCCLPEDMNSPRGHKYPTFLSELGVAFIDTDMIRDHPDCWQEYITTSHAIVAEHWDHHPHRRCQDKMGIDDRLPFYPRFNTCVGPSGSLQESRTFSANGELCTASMSPDSEVISRDQCLGWLLSKVYQQVASECLPSLPG